MDRQRNASKCALEVLVLESRQLLSGAGQIAAPASAHSDAASRIEASAAVSQTKSKMAQLKKDFKKTVVDLRRMEAGSHVTKAEVHNAISDLSKWPTLHGASISSLIAAPSTIPAADDLGAADLD